ncbi:MAG TPA: hypothetical protein VH880_01875, partial [Anaeromyxobacteraceae bacterium]
YEVRRQPVKAWILGHLADELARELREWPPPFVEWVSDELRARWSAGVAEKPPEAAVRLALRAARLDLLRDYEGADRLVREEGPRAWPGPAAEAATHLLVRFLTEKCLGLKEYAEGARLTRDDLVDAVLQAERKLFLVAER